MTYFKPLCHNVLRTLISTRELAKNHSDRLDFSQPKAARPVHKKLRRVSEFEMPDLNEYEIHSPVEATSTDKVMNHAVNAANIFNVLTNGLYAVTSSLAKNGKQNDFIKGIAEFGAKISMGVNSLFNIYDGHRKKEVFNVLGYLSELLVAAFAPYKIMGLLRGVAFTLYQIPKFATSIKPGDVCKTYAENFEMISSRIKTAFKMIADPKTYKKPLDNFGLLSGTWGGILSCAGVLSWLVTGSTKLGAWVKGLGELLIDSFQLSKEHWVSKRIHYINSGLSFIIGSLCEIISKQKNNDPTTMALYFVGSGIGRMFMTWSNTEGEQNYKPDSNNSFSSLLRPKFFKKVG